MFRTQRRSFTRLAVVAISAAAVFSACNATASPSASSTTAASQAPGGASPSAVAEHKPATITVGVLRPGATQEAADALNLQIDQFQAKYPWIKLNVQPLGVVAFRKR